MGSRRPGNVTAPSSALDMTSSGVRPTRTRTMRHAKTSTTTSALRVSECVCVRECTHMSETTASMATRRKAVNDVSDIAAPARLDGDARRASSRCAQSEALLRGIMKSNGATSSGATRATNPSRSTYETTGYALYVTKHGTLAPRRLGARPPRTKHAREYATGERYSRVVSASAASLPRPSSRRSRREGEK